MTSRIQRLRAFSRAKATHTAILRRIQEQNENPFRVLDSYRSTVLSKLVTLHGFRGMSTLPKQGKITLLLNEVYTVLTLNQTQESRSTFLSDKADVT